MGQAASDILILSNGPGELSTWVRPVVQELRQQLGTDRAQVRISVVLSPCSHASGREVAIAQSYPEVDRVQGAAHFWRFLLWGQTAANWDWRSRGVVLFLGGDQFFPVVIGRRLGYRTVVYAEWDARWPRWIDRFGVMRPDLKTNAPPQQAHKFTVVGDLMAEAGRTAPVPQATTAAPLIGLLPGSKAMKLTLGLPLMLRVAEQIHAACPAVRFGIPVAPALALTQLARYGDPAHNPLIEKFGWAQATLIPATATTPPSLQTAGGLSVELWTTFPAYAHLAQCRFCLTTVGANTAELAALGVPMMVLLPTQQLDTMRAWDGLPGLLANVPLLGTLFVLGFNWLMWRRRRLWAWPNIWAGHEIVPERAGYLDPAAIATEVLNLLAQPEQLAAMQQALRQVRGTTGAATQLVELVQAELAIAANPDNT